MSTTESETYPGAAAAWTVAAFLGMATIFSIIDRQLLNLLVDPIKHSLKITDPQMGLLQGFAFVLVSATIGLPLGRLADRVNRRNLVAIGICLWSVMTILCGFAHDFWSLFLTRGGVGIGEAMVGPAGQSLLCDYFPSMRRGKAMAAVSACSAFGGGASFLVGAAVLNVVPGDAAVYLPVIGKVLGWQLAFFVAGAPGILLSTALLFGVRETTRKEAAGLMAGAKVLGPFFELVRHRGRALICVAASSALLGYNGFALQAWGTSHFIRTFSMKPAKVGLILGVLTVIHGFIGGPIGGFLGDRFAKQRVGGRVNVHLVAALTGIPCLIIWPLITIPWLAFTVYIGAMVAVLVGVVVTSAAMSEIVPNRLRGVVLASSGLMSSILGGCLGPLLTPLAAQLFFHGEHNLTYSLIVATTPSMCIVALLTLFGRGAYARARASVIAASGPAPAAAASAQPWDGEQPVYAGQV